MRVAEVPDGDLAPVLAHRQPPGCARASSRQTGSRPKATLVIARCVDGKRPMGRPVADGPDRDLMVMAEASQVARSEPSGERATS